MTLDTTLFNALHSLAGQSRFFDLLSIFLAKYLGYFLILGSLAIIFVVPEYRKRSLYYFFFVALSLILSRAILTELIRFVYARPRPFVALGLEPLVNHNAAEPSFPSGHAAFYFALVISMWFLAKKWRWYFLAGAGAIGFARILVGLHWPTDIVAGAVVGLLSVVVVKWLLHFKNPPSHKASEGEDPPLHKASEGEGSTS